MLRKIILLFKCNAADAYIEKVILMAIAFVIGGIFLTILTSVFNDSLKTSLSDIVTDLFTW